MKLSLVLALCLVSLAATAQTRRPSGSADLDTAVAACDRHRTARPPYIYDTGWEKCPEINALWEKAQAEQASAAQTKADSDARAAVGRLLPH